MRLPVSMVVLILFVALGIVGRDDYQEALRQEKIICAHAPKPHWCPALAAK